LEAGVALTTDELGLLLKGSNPYWGSETFALAMRGRVARISRASRRLYRRGVKNQHAVGAIWQSPS
jgi:hypothetical protein